MPNVVNDDEGPRVLVADGLAPKAIELLRERLETVEANENTPEEVQAMLPTFDAAIIRSRTKVRADRLAEPGRLRVIVRAGVGLDNVDLEAAKAAGIEVHNTPTATTRSVAEHAMALMFALARHVARGDASTKAGLWEKKKLKGVELAGKTLGLAGFGRIGQELGRMCQALGMSVIAHDKFEDVVRPYADEMGVTLVSKEELLTSSDFISMHMPLVESTRGWIGKEELEAMRPTSYLVNTSRGGTVDEDALVAGLRSGTIAGAALDVFAAEPVKEPFPEAPNLVLTPHVAGTTAEGQDRAGLDAARIVLSFLGLE